MNNIAGAIITFSRPQYYGKVLRSLENCENSNKIPWHVFQDGYKDLPKDDYGYKEVSEENINRNIQLTNNSKLNVVSHNINEYNRGVNFAFNSVTMLFGLGYDTIFIFEDDLIVSKYYLNLLYQCSIEYPDIVASFHSVRIQLNRNPKILAKCPAARLWGFYLTRTVWNLIENDWINFYICGFTLTLY